MLYSLTHWLENNMQTCGFKKAIGFDCPGCGTQRAFIALLKGQVMESIRLYPALIPMLILFLFLILHLKFKFTKGGIYLMYTFILVVSIILISYFFKMLR